MNEIVRKTIGPFVVIVLFGIAALGYQWFKPQHDSHLQKVSSNAKNIRLTVTGARDNFAGYAIFGSPPHKNLLLKSGINLNMEMDDADIEQRIIDLQSGKIQIAVASVDTDILLAAKLKYPGLIVMVIDESKGADKILANKNRVKSLNDLKGKKDIRVAYPKNTMSDFFAKATDEHFGLPEITPDDPNLYVNTKDSAGAVDALLPGKADVAICWEPDCSRALKNPDIVELLSTANTEKLIVDVLLMSKQFIKDSPSEAEEIIFKYFKALKYYRDDPDALIKLVMKETKNSKEDVEKIIAGIKWANFEDNYNYWFGLGEDAYDIPIIETIESAAKILVKAGDFDESDWPIPEKNPYYLTYDEFLKNIYKKHQSSAGFTTPGAKGTAAPMESSVVARFKALSNAQWVKIRKNEVGTLNVKPIVFQDGKTSLSIDAKEVIDEAVERLKHYPNFRIVLEGHTAPSRVAANKERNEKLSRQRAESVGRYLELTHDIDPNRFLAIGIGGEKPLPKPADRSRTVDWKARCSRVEPILVRQGF